MSGDWDSDFRDSCLCPRAVSLLSAPRAALAPGLSGASHLRERAKMGTRAWIPKKVFCQHPCGLLGFLYARRAKCSASLSPQRFKSPLLVIQDLDEGFSPHPWGYLGFPWLVPHWPLGDSDLVPLGWMDGWGEQPGVGVTCWRCPRGSFLQELPQLF